MQIIQPLFIIGAVIVAGGTALAAEPIDVCQSIVTTSARNIGLKTTDSQYLRTVHDKYCEDNGSVKTSAKSGGLSIPALPISLTAGATDSETKIKNFCSNHDNTSAGAENSLDWKSIVVEKAIEAAVQCVGIASKSKSSVVYDIVSSDVISIKMEVSPGHVLDVLGISHDGTVACEGADVSNPGKTITYETGAGQKVTAATGFHSVVCKRKPYAEKNGNKYFNASGMVVSTNGGTLDIFWPQETVFPLITASDIQTNIAFLEDKINILTKKLDVNLLPLGSIIPWLEKDGSPPVGWAKCDGSDLSNCLDLRGLFLIGASSDAVAVKGGGEKLNIEIASDSKIARRDGWNEGGKNYIGSASVDLPKPPYISVMYIKKIQSKK